MTEIVEEGNSHRIAGTYWNQILQRGVYVAWDLGMLLYMGEGRQTGYSLLRRWEDRNPDEWRAVVNTCYVPHFDAA